MSQLFASLSDYPGDDCPGYHDLRAQLNGIEARQNEKMNTMFSELSKTFQQSLSTLSSRVQKLEANSVLNETSFELRQYSSHLNDFMIKMFKKKAAKVKLRPLAVFLVNHDSVTFQSEKFIFHVFTSLHKYLQVVSSATLFNAQVKGISISEPQLERLQAISLDLYNTYQYTPSLAIAYKDLQDPHVSSIAHPWRISSPNDISQTLNAAFNVLGGIPTGFQLQSPKDFRITQSILDQINNHDHYMMTTDFAEHLYNQQN